MASFFSLLEQRVEDCASLLCVGLDPHLADLPAPTAEAATEFCLNLIRQTAPYAAAFKPNAAFFEQFGAAGWEALKTSIQAVQEQSHRLGSFIPVILDAKRGDIASTAEAYAQSAFQVLGAHAITLSPYLGRDSIEPFIQKPEQGVFLLCKTSNPGAGDLQDLAVTEEPTSGLWQPLYLQVARLAQSWNVRDNLGLVVGATQPEALARVRALVPEMWFLAPGIGAQGGDLEKALRAGLRSDGKGMLLPISRGISRSQNAAQAAADFRDAIRAYARF
ncbi:MAG: orotidine-5'-phosphate decarboxylase [Anaerolineae bacterium]|nr:MAG: orotidine-5'-phosphate decarboxylase [Anaerolineae bacterium]